MLPYPQELVAEGAGDHVLLLRLWELWEASGCTRDFCKEYGLDLRGMNFARDIRRQLEGSWGCAPTDPLTCAVCGWCNTVPRYPILQCGGLGSWTKEQTWHELCLRMVEMSCPVTGRN